MFNLNKEAVNENRIYHNKSNSTLIKFNEEITDNFMTVIFNTEHKTQASVRYVMLLPR